MLPIILTAVITAIVTTIFVTYWSGSAKGQGDASIYVTTALLIKEVNLMAEKLGYKDIGEYWLKTKGEEYAKIGVNNLVNATNYINLTKK